MPACLPALFPFFFARVPVDPPSPSTLLYFEANPPQQREQPRIYSASSLRTVVHRPGPTRVGGASAGFPAHSSPPVPLLTWPARDPTFPRVFRRPPPPHVTHPFFTTHPFFDVRTPSPTVPGEISAAKPHGTRSRHGPLTHGDTRGAAVRHRFEYRRVYSGPPRDPEGNTSARRLAAGLFRGGG